MEMSARQGERIIGRATWEFSPPACLEIVRFFLIPLLVQCIDELFAEMGPA